MITIKQERDAYRAALEKVLAHCHNYLSHPGSWNCIYQAIETINGVMDPEKIVVQDDEVVF